MTHQSNTRWRLGHWPAGYWPIVVGFALVAVISATGIVAAGSPWASRVVSSAAAVSQRFVPVTYRPTSSDIDDYVQGLAKAIPGSVRR